MPQSKQRALSREIILSTALDLVDEEGLSALSLRSLGKRLGVSQAAFYRHFPDKAALLEGIAEQVWRLTFESFLDRVDTGAFDPESTPTPTPTPTASKPPEDALASPLSIYMRTYAHCLAQTLRSHPGAVMLLLTHDSLYRRRGRSARGRLPRAAHRPVGRERRTRSRGPAGATPAHRGSPGWSLRLHRSVRTRPGGDPARLELRLDDQFLDLAHDARATTERAQLRAHPSDPRGHGGLIDEGGGRLIQEPAVDGPLPRPRFQDRATWDEAACHPLK